MLKSKTQEKVKKMSKETLNKIIETIEVAIAPAIITAGVIWGFDWALYVGAFTSAVIAILRCVEIFLKK